jgi:CcmD family protein
MPALPLHEAGKYVAAAYIVLFALILIYVAIMAARLSRIERELGELLELTERPPTASTKAATGPRADLSSEADPGPQTDPDPEPLDVGRPQSTTA